MLCSRDLQGTLEVIRDLHFHKFSFERERLDRRLCCGELRRVETRDAKNCYAREARNNLFEQPHLFPAQLRDVKKHFRHIAAWARKTLDISLRKWIALQI
jgi:hypothetical protein